VNYIIRKLNIQCSGYYLCLMGKTMALHTQLLINMAAVNLTCHKMALFSALLMLWFRGNHSWESLSASWGFVHLPIPTIWSMSHFC